MTTATWNEINVTLEYHADDHGDAENHHDDEDQHEEVHDHEHDEHTIIRYTLIL